MFLIGFQLPFQYYFKATSKKSHFFLTSNEQVNLSLGDLIIETSKSQKLLGITISLHLTNTLLNCKKASQKLHSIARISSYLNKNKFRLIMNAFFRPSLDIVHLPGSSIEDMIEDITTR